MTRRKSFIGMLCLIGALLVLMGWWLFRPFEQEDRVAVIHVEGVITGGRGQGGLFGDGGGTDSVIRQIQSARDDASIKAVVIRINSPGGSAPASQEVGEELKKLRATGKVVVASMGDIAASGGYWIAALCDKIYANPGTITGSIGVYIPYANWEELFKKIGVHGEKIKSGPHKDMLSPERPMTETERVILQDMVDDLYDQFVAVVVEGRKMDPEKVRQLADGRIYTGRKAKSLGLVDEMGTMEDAVNAAAKMAGISGKPVIREYGHTGLWETIFGPSSQSFADVLFGRLLRGEMSGERLMNPTSAPQFR
ncbi:MAG: sppA [Firmicutes bacterium]|nr:sppA [Bacillota bacterium]